MPYADPAKERENNNARSRRYYAAHREERIAVQRAYRAAGYQRPPGANLQSNCGITYARYLRLVILQCGACVICGGVPGTNPDSHPKVSKLVVDHDHNTGQVRGLLCGPCNLMLGQSGESAVRLLAGLARIALNSGARASGQTLRRNAF